MTDTASAKDIRVEPISARDATALVKRVHYSHTAAQNSQLHLGVFLHGELHGAMQFGPSLDKRKMQHLVAGTPWNGFLELNRLAFDEHLPRNSESRALAIAFRIIRKQYPHVQWIVSFADATQCGDGTIYRAAGFLLTAMRKNNTIWEGPAHSRHALLGVTAMREAKRVNRVTTTKGQHIVTTGAATMKSFTEAGFKPMPGFQLRYIYFLDPKARARLTVPVLPFSRIEEVGASMYLGKPRAKQAMPEHPSGQRRGSTDPHAPKSKRPALPRLAAAVDDTGEDQARK